MAVSAYKENLYFIYLASAAARHGAGGRYEYRLCGRRGACRKS